MLSSLQAEPADLFEPWTPPWIEGETLFSLCSRYHRIAGGHRASDTCQRLFDTLGRAWGTTWRAVWAS